MRGTGSTTDPFAFTEKFGNSFNKTGSKTPRHPSVLTGNIGVFLACGQSNIANSDSALYTTVNTTKVHELNVMDGGLYAGQAPLLGTSVYSAGGSWLPRFADALIGTGTYDHVVLISLGIGSTFAADWAPGGKQHQKLLVACRRASALGLTITAALFQCGESDGLYGTSGASYLASVQAMIAGVRDEGMNAPWLIGKSTYSGTTYPAIRGAVDSVVDGTGIFLGADTDGLTGANRSDGVHWTGAGSAACAALWVAAFNAAI